MSSAAVKPVCSGRGRGRGKGWVGNFKPKPCNLRKEDIVNLHQTYANADEDDEINHIVSEKSCLITQSSVEDLSEKIARGILATQDGETKQEIRTTDLSGNNSEKEVSDITSNNNSNLESWIESIDNLEMQETVASIFHIPTDEKSVINEIHDDQKNNTEVQVRTENVTQAYMDIRESPTSQTECFTNLSTMKKEIKGDKKLNAVMDEKGTLADIYIECDLDEKPKDLCDSFYRLNLSENDNLALDEISASNKKNDNLEAADHNDILLKAVHAKEFVPIFCIPEDEKNNGGLVEYNSFEEQPFETINEDQIVMCVLNDVISALRYDPGDFDNVIEDLTDHLLNFVTQEETLKQVVNTIIGKAITEPDFGFMAGKISQHFDEQKTLELENGVNFRKVFFKRCQDEFNAVKELCKEPKSCKENKDRIHRTSILFGELLCTMKIKGHVNPMYKHAVSQFIDIFLDIGIEENILTLTKLLKLVGPELDNNRPKDIEALFDKVKDFYLDGSRSGNLPKDVKKDLWGVYKLHSRDWDRPTSPEPPAATPHLERKKSNEASTSRSSPVNWEEYYGGDDSDLYQIYMDMSSAEQEFEAYEEFLHMSGQV